MTFESRNVLPAPERPKMTSADVQLGPTPAEPEVDKYSRAANSIMVVEVVDAVLSVT